MIFTILDFSDYREVDTGSAIHFSGKIVIENINTGEKFTIDCEGMNDMVDNPLSDAMRVLFQAYCFTEDIRNDLDSDDVWDFICDFLPTRVAKKKYKITGKSFFDKPTEENAMKWLKSLKLKLHK